MINNIIRDFRYFTKGYINNTIVFNNILEENKSYLR